MVVQITLSYKSIIFRSVVFVLEQEIDSLQQHMVIYQVLPVIFVSCDQILKWVKHLPNLGIQMTN